MTLAACRQHLFQLFADPENKVIALSGKWGTGKTHLWRQVQETSQDERVKDAVTISLFGLGSLSDLKMKIAQDLLPKLEKGNSLSEFTKKNWASIKSVAKKISPRLSVIDEIELIALPMLLKGRFIVIDDIERKHDKLSIDEILGLIDECVQNLGCRILLILNTDQLKKDKDIDLWETLREKVIDQELRLDTTASEAFDIARGLTPSRYAENIKPSVEACAVSNIRIVRKILRVTNRLLAGRDELPEHVLTRVLPSIALISAIHYKGLDDGPTMDFVLRFNAMQVALHTMSEDDKRRESPEMKTQTRWHLLMDRLEIRSTDAFEELVADYLKTGMYDGVAVGEAIDRFTKEGRQLTMRARADTFLEHCWWHPEISEHELLEEVRSMIPDVRYLDVYKITAVHDRVLTLQGGGPVAEELVDAWLTWARARRELNGDWEIDDDIMRVRRPLHPRIAEEFRSALDRQQMRVTILEVCRKVSTDHGWDEREKRRMRAATPADYEAAIRSAAGADFRVLVMQSMDFLKDEHFYAESFGGAGQSFFSACRSIVGQEPAGRLAMLVRGVFKSQGMEACLDKKALPATEREA